MDRRNNYNDAAFEGNFEVTAAAFDRTAGAATTLANVNAYTYDDDDDVASVGETVSMVEDFQAHLHPADMTGQLVPYPAAADDDSGTDDNEEDGSVRKIRAKKSDETEDTDDDNTASVYYHTDVQQQPPDSEEATAPPHNKPASRSVVSAGLESIKYLTSMGLLLFSVVVVMASIFSQQTVATAEMGFPSYVAAPVFWFLIVWLATMEGGQGALVGLQPVDKACYEKTHPKAAKTTTLAHRGDNMERFIVGRQFLVVLVVFVINMVRKRKTFFSGPLQLCSVQS